MLSLAAESDESDMWQNIYELPLPLVWAYPSYTQIEHHTKNKCLLFFSCVDRYVILGNHRDAWVFGAVDPSSGTAAMLEITRVMGDLVKRGKL